MRYKRGMRILYFGAAAVFSLAAVFFAYTETAAPGWVGIAAIVLAGVFLVLGLYEHYKRQETPSLELDDEERATIKRMKQEGDFQLAVKQVQMWKRYASPEDAARIVREV